MGNEKGNVDFDGIESILKDQSVETRLTMANIDANYKLYVNSITDDEKNKYKKLCGSFKAKLKPIYTVDMVGTKNKENITSYNNYYIIDIDGVNVQQTMNTLKDDVYIKFIFESPTSGVKCFVELDIPEGNVNNDVVLDFIERYVYINMETYFKNTYNIQIDDKCKNINRACYIPSQRGYYRNDDASLVELWSKYIKTNEYKDIINPPVKKVGRPIVNKKSATKSILFTKALEHLRNNGIVAFEDYNEWLNLGFILYGNNDDLTGNTLYHEFSKLSPKYSQKNVNDKWKSISKTGYDPNKLSIKWFYFIMEKNYGFSDKENKYDAFKYTERDISSIFNNMMGYDLILDEVSKRYYLRKDNVDVQLNDIEMNQLLKDFRDGYINIEMRKLREYLFTKDIIKSENFIKNILDKNRNDDPKEFNKIFNYIDVNDKEMTKNIFYRWMLGSMKNMFGEYGTYYDEILILKGDQGIGKSTLINSGLLKMFIEYTATGFDFKDKGKDNIKLLSSYMFSIDDELSMSTRSDIKIIKKITSISHTQIRLPYAATEENFKRISSFIGMTNDDTIFNDDTGGRRFLIVDISSKINNDILKLDFGKIWGYIYNEWMIGKDPIKDSNITQSEIMKNADSYRYKNDLEEFIESNFENDDDNEMTPDEVRDIIVRHFNNSSKSITYITTQIIGAKLKSVLKSNQVIKKIGGKTKRLWNIRYINSLNNLSLENISVNDETLDNIFKTKSYIKLNRQK